MLIDSGEIIREVGMASNLDDALAILVQRIKASLPVDAVAVYLTGAEAGQFVLRAYDTQQPERTEQVHEDSPAGLAGLVGERRELVVLENASTHPRYASAVETGGRHFDTFLGVPLIHYRQVVGVLVAWKQAHRRFETVPDRQAVSRDAEEAIFQRAILAARAELHFPSGPTTLHSTFLRPTERMLG